MNITIVSLHDDNMAEIGEISSPNFTEYGTGWKYDVIIHQRALNPNRHPAWSKITALIDTLKMKECDWAFWIDCDALFMNHSISLESRITEGANIFKEQHRGLLDPRLDLNLIFASDFNGIATGAMFVKNCDWSLRFLSAVDLCGELSVNDPDGHGNKWEQNTIKHLLTQFPELANRAIALPQQSMNYHYHAKDFVAGGFILQFPVLPRPERAMAEMLPSVVRRVPETLSASSP